MPSLTPQQAFQLASQHHRAGRLHEADQLYRQVLALQPTNAAVLNNLGVIARQMGHNEIAVDFIRRTLALNPNNAEGYCNLGSALQAIGRLDEAIAAYRQAIVHKETLAGAHFSLGAALKNRGDLAEAIVSYRRAITLEPNDATVICGLGDALLDSGQTEEAAAAFQRAISLGRGSAPVFNNLGNALKSLGKPEESIAAYQRAIALHPSYAAAHYNLGNALSDIGRIDEAITAYREAIIFDHGLCEAHSNLGNALKDKGELDEAIAAYRQAIGLNSDYAEAFSNLGAALKEKGQIDEAIAVCRQAIALKPVLAQAHVNLGNGLRGNGQLDEAIAAYRRAIILNPRLPKAFSNLGNALKDKGELDQAIAAYRQAIALDPRVGDFHCNLGTALKDNGQIDEAIAAYRQAIVPNFNLAEAHSNLSSALLDKWQIDEAIAAARQAIAINAEMAEAHNNLGSALKESGQLSAAIAAHREASRLDSDDPRPDDNLVFSLHYHPAYDVHAIANEHRRWNRQHAMPLAKLIQPHPNDRSPDRRLRIGYVSPDFRNHVVGQNLVPLFSHHDRQRFEIFCYAQVLRPEPMSGEFERLANGWRRTVALSDEQLSNQIREDRIDILVDLALHTAGNRLLVFARKPAPVQATFAGYPSSTGLTAIDYRLSDPYLDPPGMDESIYTEKTIRLPDSFWCYDALDSGDIAVNTLPALKSGVVTFGCLNNFCKINDGVLELWAKVMRQVAGSRLLLFAKLGSHRQRTLDYLCHHGIEPERIEFLLPQPRRTYLEYYHRIDLGLDSFPYNGHTTSLDSFWMGVPVVTLVGKTAVARAGWCQLSNLGLTELAAHAPEQFAKIAVELASDLPRLEHLRSTLRGRMERSPLMDGAKFARNIEAAYRQMWNTWCGSNST